jgi:hypothetical protein
MFGVNLQGPVVVLLPVGCSVVAGDAGTGNGTDETAPDVVQPVEKSKSGKILRQRLKRILSGR